MTDFLPVLLGSDANVYGMARSFYGQYGVTSAAVCKGALVATANSKLVKIAVLEPRLEEDEVFVRTLVDFARRQTRPLVLVSLRRRLYHPAGPPSGGTGALLPFCLPGPANGAGS